MQLLATGKSLTRTRLCQLLIVTDDDARLVAVGVVGKDNQTVNVTFVGERTTMILRARWTGDRPSIGEYVMSKYRPRSAYRIVDVRVTGRTAEHTSIELRVERVDLPLLDPDAVVHPWRWDPRGKNAGVKGSIDVKTSSALCDRHREVLTALVRLGDWVRPHDVGGTGGSYHYASLTRLVAKGLVERRVRVRDTRLPPDRYSYEYRATDLGRSRNV